MTGGGLARRAAAIWCLAALAAFASACQRTAPGTSTIRIAYQREMISLDPHAHEDSMTEAVLGAVYEGLVRFERGVGVQPALAERWTTPDDVTWRFWLRRGVRFHDGRLVTVEDVLRSLEKARTDPASRVASYLAPVASVVRVTDDPYAFEIITRGPVPLMLPRLAEIAIVPWDGDPSNPTGTGPLRWMDGGLVGPVHLERWTGYWGDPAPVDHVEVLFVTETAEPRRLVEESRVDVLPSVTERELASWSLPDGWQLVHVESDATYLLALNLRIPPLDDPRVRQAIDLGIDREALCRAAFPAGSAVPARSLVPPGVFGYDADALMPAADPEAARRLLRDAGVTTGSRVTLEHGGADPAVLDFLVTSLAAIGLDLEIVELEYRTLLRRSDTGASPMFVFGWNFDYADSSGFLDAMVHAPDSAARLGLLNGTGYADDTVDRWVEEAAVSASTGERLQRLRWALGAVLEARPYLPLYHRSRLALARDGVGIDPRIDSMARPQEIGWVE
jgi:peptide/nickel transport system substrate-binding protein